MTLRAFAAALGLAVAAAAPAAAWTTQSGTGTVLVQQQESGWTIQLRCQKSVPNVLGFTLIGPSAGTVSGVTSVAIGAELPGGERRGDRIAVTSNGQTATGNWQVSDRTLEIFAQGLTLGVRLGEQGRALTTNMTGTAAARSTIRSVCGF